MSDEERISARQIYSRVVQNNSKRIIWRGIPITLRTFIPLNEVSQFVDSVIGSCINKSNNSFNPEMADFSFRINVILRYTNVDTPDNIKEQYELAYNTDLYDKIIESVNKAQIESIKKAINIYLKQ